MKMFEEDQQKLDELTDSIIHDLDVYIDKVEEQKEKINKFRDETKDDNHLYTYDLQIVRTELMLIAIKTVGELTKKSIESLKLPLSDEEYFK